MLAENINSAILTWARETAGLSIEDAAKQIGLSDSKISTAIEKLHAYEAGGQKPTRIQLLKMSNIYHRPLSIFYLDNPPMVAKRGKDFRTMEYNVTKKEAARLDALLRDAQVRQDMVRSMLEDDEDLHPLDFVGSLTIDIPIDKAVSQLQKIINLTSGMEGDHTKKSPKDYFKVLRSRIEANGTFVLLIGNLGSHHTNISEKVFRGFAIADDLAPFIIINSQDAIRARTFTLIHEFVHILLDASGVSAAPPTMQPLTKSSQVERYCNDVAGSFLLPDKALHEVDQLTNKEDTMDKIQEIADNYNVSTHMVAYRLLRNGTIPKDVYHKLANIYEKNLQFQKAKAKNTGKKGGPNYYTIRRFQVGDALLSLVHRMIRANELSHTKAAKILGVQPSSVEPLISSMRPNSKRYDQKLVST